MNKIIYAYIAWLLLIMLCACNSANKTQQPVKEFEGVITYKTKFTSWKDSDNAAASTDTLRVYYSHGNLAKINSANNPSTLKKEIFLFSERKYYGTRFGTDTLYWANAAPAADMQLSKMDVAKSEKTILGHQCEDVYLNIKTRHDSLTYLTENTYTFSRNYLQIDKNHLNWYKVGFFDKFINESGCFYLGFKYVLHYKTSDKILYTKQYEAIEVKEQKVDPGIFNPDRSLPLKEIKL
ncbi:hypothetical protein ACFGVR_11740 [Mucilaginibacter sp. AW1-3]